MANAARLAQALGHAGTGLKAMAAFQMGTGGLSGGSGHRKLSAIEPQEMASLNAALRRVFCACRSGDADSGVDSAGFVQLLATKGLVDRRLTEADAGLAWASVKLGKRSELNFDRFQEAVRKVPPPRHPGHSTGHPSHSTCPRTPGALTTVVGML
jgi:hypothetical protein